MKSAAEKIALKEEMKKMEEEDARINKAQLRLSAKRIKECAEIQAEWMIDHVGDAVLEDFDVDIPEFPEELSRAIRELPETEGSERVNDLYDFYLGMALAKNYLPQGYKIIKK